MEIEAMYSDIKELVLTSGVDFAINAVSALLIIIIGRIVVKMVTSFSLKIMTKANVDVTLRRFLKNIIYMLLMVVVVLAALSTLGIETTSFVAILGAASLAIGLALQGTLGNIGAGVLLIFFRPFKVGDFVSAGGEMGVAEAVTLFATTLHTPDNKVIIIPNSAVMGGNITNFSAMDTRRVDLTFGIGYDDDLKAAKALLEKLAGDDLRVLQEPAPFIAVSELADSSVNFVVRLWVSSDDYWGVYFDMIENVKLTFDANGISIPYPQMDIHSKSE